MSKMLGQVNKAQEETSTPMRSKPPDTKKKATGEKYPKRSSLEKSMGHGKPDCFNSSNSLHLALSVDLLRKVNRFPLSSVFETHFV